MRTPETRSVRQCTYTPVVTTSKDFIPQKPFLKHLLLSVVLPNATTGKLVLNEIATDAAHKEMKAAIAKAASQVWEGDVAAAAITLRNLETGDITRFAEDVIRAETALLDKAEKDAEEAIVALAPANGVKPEATDVLRREISEMRDAIVERLQTAFAPAAAKAARAGNGHGAANATSRRRAPATASVANNNKVAEAAKSAVASAKRIPDMSSLEQELAGTTIGLVTRGSLQEQIAKKQPRTAEFLGASRFFSLPCATRPTATHEMTHLLSFTAMRRYVLMQRRAMLRTLVETMKIEPIGYLHLERLDFSPLGYVRGELVYSLPLTPKESVRVTHREWSRTETEYTKIVATSLETATQDAISEKSELTESVSSEQQHSTALDASVSASGSYGPVSISTTVGYNCQQAESQSRQQSARRSREITKTASSRAKQEMKISFRVATQYETEEQSYREITNPLEHAVRWDFHRLMKKWQIDLYRYDIRLTYDVVIPEPGSYLLRKYVRLQQLNDELAKPNPFQLAPTMIGRGNWMELGAIYGASLDPPPDDIVSTVAHDEQTYSGRVIGEAHVEIALPEGYEFTWWYATGSAYCVEGSSTDAGSIDVRMNLNTDMLNCGAKRSNRYSWRYLYDLSDAAEPNKGSVFAITVWAFGKLKSTMFQDWQMKCYERLVDSANAQYENKRLRLTRVRDDLLAELNREDALELRKIEKEELMKGVLRWVLGPQFSFYPSNLPALDLSADGDLVYYDPSMQHVQSSTYEPMIKHGELVEFLHQAVEWENVNYVLYPYFWTDDYRWDFKQGLYHGDFVHRNFLRAGAARVVLTIRPGFEKAFLSLMETGQFGQLLPSSHPYMTVADELKAMAQTSYPYTPSANEENPANLVDKWYEFTPTGALDVVEGTVLEENNA